VAADFGTLALRIAMAVLLNSVESDTFPLWDVRNNHKLTENIARFGFNYKF
jgi:hypothetical protein